MKSIGIYQYVPQKTFVSCVNSGNQDIRLIKQNFSEKEQKQDSGSSKKSIFFIIEKKKVQVFQLIFGCKTNQTFDSD